MGIQISGSRTGSSRLAIKFPHDFFKNSQLTPKTGRVGRKKAEKFALRPIQTVFFFRPNTQSPPKKKFINLKCEKKEVSVKENRCIYSLKMKKRKSPHIINLKLTYFLKIMIEKNEKW